MMRWLIPIGLGAAVAALVINAKKKEESNPTLRRTPIRSRSPGQPVNFIPGLYWEPPGNTFNDKLDYCWANVGTPSVARNCLSWMQAQGLNTTKYFAAADA